MHSILSGFALLTDSLLIKYADPSACFFQQVEEDGLYAEYSGRFCGSNIQKNKKLQSHEAAYCQAAPLQLCCNLSKLGILESDRIMLSDLCTVCLENISHGSDQHVTAI